MQDNTKAVVLPSGPAGLQLSPRKLFAHTSVHMNDEISTVLGTPMSGEALPWRDHRRRVEMHEPTLFLLQYAFRIVESQGQAYSRGQLDGYAPQPDNFQVTL